MPEWPSGSEFRETAVKLYAVLSVVDWHMGKVKDAGMAWTHVSIGLGLPSTEGKSVTRIADELGITKQGLSRGVTKFLRAVHLPPAFGLKSEEARIAYQQCHF